MASTLSELLPDVNHLPSHELDSVFKKFFAQAENIPFFYTDDVLDPRLLQEIEDIKVFSDTFSLKETFELQSLDPNINTTNPVFSKNAYLALRFIIYRVSAVISLAYKQKVKIKAIYITDEKSTMCLVIRLGKVRQRDGTCLVEIVYNLGKTSDPRHYEHVYEFKNLLKQFGNDGFVKMVALPQHIYYLHYLLNYNSSLLPYDYVQNHIREYAPRDSILKPSFIVSLTLLAPEEMGELLITIKDLIAPKTKFSAKVEKQCDFCFEKRGTKKCGACNTRSYCSRECQVSDWKTHKVECKKVSKKPDVIPSGNSILIPLKSVMDNLGMGHVSMFNMNSSSSRAWSHGGLSKKGINIPSDEIFLIKVQCTGQIQTPLLIYDRLKRMYTSAIHPGLATQLISNGMLKCYFNAKLEGESVRVFVDSLPKQNQPW